MNEIVLRPAPLPTPRQRTGLPASGPDRRQPGIAGPAIAGCAAIALFLGGFGAWAALAPLASAAIAPGMIRVESHRKTVQHLEGGIIRELRVQDGAKVRAGDVLLVLDTTRVESSADAARADRDAALAAAARLRALRDDAEAMAIPAELKARAAEPAIEDLLRTQRRLFETARSNFKGQLAILGQQLEQLGAQAEGYRQQVASADQQLRLIADQIATVAKLLKDGLERRPRLLELQGREAQIRGTRGDLLAQIARLKEQEGEVKLKMLAARDLLMKEVTTQLERTLEDLAVAEAKLRAAEDQVTRTEIRAPIAGTVMGLKFFTVGGVVSPGMPIMEIVPDDDALVVEARVDPLDIDVVHAGLEAEVRLSALRQRRTPTVRGRVLDVSADLTTDEKADRGYYRATIRLDEADLARARAVNPSARTVHPGMPAEVMIRLQDRTFLDYMLGPLTDSFAHAFREE